MKKVRSMTWLAGLICSVSCIGLVQAAGSVGLSAGFMPKYEGTKKYKTELFPAFSYEDRHLFIAPKAGMPALGFKIDLSEQWQIGAFGAYASGRKASDDKHLTGTGKIHKHAVAGVYSQWRLDRLLMEVSYFHALKDGYGGNVQLGASYRLWQNPTSSLRVGGVLHWSDSDAMQTYFGVSPIESQRSGGRLQAYNASAGLRSGAIYGVHSLQLSDKWRLNTSLGVRQLMGDAADGPIAQHKTSVFGSVGVGYHF